MSLSAGGLERCKRRRRGLKDGLDGPGDDGAVLGEGDVGVVIKE